MKVKYLSGPERQRHKVQGARHKEGINFLLLFLPCALNLEPLLGAGHSHAIWARPHSLLPFRLISQFPSGKLEKNVLKGGHSQAATPIAETLRDLAKECLTISGVDEQPMGKFLVVQMAFLDKI